MSVMRAPELPGVWADPDRAFTVEDVKCAREAFITGASTLVTPVVRIDGANVGSGAPGEMANRLRQLYMAKARLDPV